jgi:hypothetical protein
MEQERENDAIESAAQIQSGVIMKASGTVDGRTSQFQDSPAKNDYSANEVLKYTVIQFAFQYITLPWFVKTLVLLMARSC